MTGGNEFGAGLGYGGGAALRGEVQGPAQGFAGRGAVIGTAYGRTVGSAFMCSRRTPRPVSPRGLLPAGPRWAGACSGRGARRSVRPVPGGEVIPRWPTEYAAGLPPSRTPGIRFGVIYVARPTSHPYASRRWSSSIVVWSSSGKHAAIPGTSFASR